MFSARCFANASASVWRHFPPLVLRCTSGRAGPNQGVDRVRSIVRGRDGTIWAAASSGVYILRDGWAIAHAEEEVLPSHVASSVYQDRDGRIWAATTEGFGVYHAESDRDPPHTFVSEKDNSHQMAPNVLVPAGILRYRPLELYDLQPLIILVPPGWPRLDGVCRGEFRHFSCGVRRIAPV